MTKRRRASATPTRQRPLKGGRLQLSTGFEPRIWRAVQAEARRFHVSVPFVLSVMAADMLGIELDTRDVHRFTSAADHAEVPAMPVFTYKGRR